MTNHIIELKEILGKLEIIKKHMEQDIDEIKTSVMHLLKEE